MGNKPWASEDSRLAVEFLKANPQCTLKEVLAKFPGCTDRTLRSHIAYHGLPYKRERTRQKHRARASEGMGYVDKEREAKLREERASAPWDHRLRAIMGKQFDALERLWGLWIKK